MIVGTSGRTVRRRDRCWWYRFRLRLHTSPKITLVLHSAYRFFKVSIVIQAFVAQRNLSYFATSFHLNHYATDGKSRPTEEKKTWAAAEFSQIYVLGPYRYFRNWVRTPEIAKNAHERLRNRLSTDFKKDTIRPGIPSSKDGPLSQGPGKEGNTL